MNQSKKTVTETEVKVREYGLLKYLSCTDLDDAEAAVWRETLNGILTDEDYLKQVIKLEQDEFGMTTLIGMVTPSLMLSNSEMISKEIIEELVHNILYNYIDKAKNKPLMHTADFGGLSYLSLILMQHDMELKDEFQQTIKAEVLKHCKGKFDYSMVSYFLMNKAIDIKYKKEIIDNISDENLWQLQERWENALMANLYDMLKNPEYAEQSDSEFSEAEMVDNIPSSFDEVLKIIEKRLEG